MLTAEENEVLCRVGPGTPMGTVLRRYWTPAFQLGDLPAPDCPPVRVTILGENFVAFRDTDRPAGFPRRAVLSPRRVARARPGRGLRHPVPLPRLEVRRGRDHHGDPQPRHHPRSGSGSSTGPTRCARQAGSAGSTSGRRAPSRRSPRSPGPPPTPDELLVTEIIMDCNWMQVLEGSIDSSHVGILHLDTLATMGAGPRSVGSFDFAGEPWDLDMPVPGRGGQGGPGQGAPDGGQASGPATTTRRASRSRTPRSASTTRRSGT